MVDRQSARIGVPNEKLSPIGEDHRGICRIASAESEAYKALGFWVATLVRETLLERTSGGLFIKFGYRLSFF